MLCDIDHCFPAAHRPLMTRSLGRVWPWVPEGSCVSSLAFSWALLAGGGTFKKCALGEAVRGVALSAPLQRTVGPSTFFSLLGHKMSSFVLPRTSHGDILLWYSLKSNGPVSHGPKHPIREPNNPFPFAIWLSSMLECFCLFVLLGFEIRFFYVTLAGLKHGNTPPQQQLPQFPKCSHYRCELPCHLSMWYCDGKLTRTPLAGRSTFQRRRLNSHLASMAPFPLTTDWVFSSGPLLSTFCFVLCGFEFEISPCIILGSRILLYLGSENSSFPWFSELILFLGCHIS